MIIQSNLPAMSAYRNVNVATKRLSTDVEKLSSGYRVNRAGDDAAGLAISEKMRAQIRGLNRASTNVQEGVSLLDVADGALQTCHDIVGRMRELAVQSASDTNETLVDRGALDKEYQQLMTELDDIARNTDFNGIKLLDGSIAKLNLVGVTMDVTGLFDYGTQIAAKTVVNGINKTSVSSYAVSKPSPSVADVTKLTATAGSTTSGTIVNNGQSLQDIYDLGDNSAYEDQQGRTDAGLNIVAAGGDLTVDVNGYNGYVYNDTGSNDLTVANNSGFVYSNGDNTTINNNDHTGQVLIEGGIGDTAIIGTNTGGEIQVGSIDSFTITDNANLNVSKPDYTHYYVYHHTDGTTSSAYFSDIIDRVNTAANPQHDGSSSFYDPLNGTLQPDGKTYLTVHNVSGSHIGKPYNSISEYYVLIQPSNYDLPKTSESAYNYVYNTYWDESQTGLVTSDAVANTIGNNSGIIDLTNDAANTIANITNNSGTIYAANMDVDVTNNSGTIYATNDQPGSTFDLTDTNYSTLYLWSETATVNANSYRIIANDTVKTLTVGTNSYSGYSNSNNNNPGSDGQSTVTTHYSTGLTSSADETIIGTNSGSAVILAGELTVGTNSGYLEVKSGATIKDIASNTGTIILQANVNVTDWIANNASNSGTIELHGDTNPPLKLTNNSGTIKLMDGATVEITNNTGTLEIGGDRIGGTAGDVTLGDNNATIRNGGDLTITGTNFGNIDNYGTVTFDAGATNAGQIRHFASNLNTSGIDFPTGIDLNKDIAAINAELQNHTYSITFTANGQTVTVDAYWEATNSIALGCTCDSDVDICPPDATQTVDGFKLVFNLPNDLDDGYVVLSESDELVAQGFRFELSDTISVNGESGTVGRTLTYYAGIEVEATAQYEANAGLTIQSGANKGDETVIHIEKMATDVLGDGGCLGCGCGMISSTNLLSQASSSKAIGVCDTASKVISTNRVTIGAMRNRLDYKMSNLNSSAENLSAAESLIRDMDLSKGVTSKVVGDILMQSSMAMLMQANTLPQSVLQLLR